MTAYTSTWRCLSCADTVAVDLELWATSEAGDRLFTPDFVIRSVPCACGQTMVRVDELEALLSEASPTKEER